MTRKDAVKGRTCNATVGTHLAIEQMTITNEEIDTRRNSVGRFLETISSIRK
jgi:hypothetical protein